MVLQTRIQRKGEAQGWPGSHGLPWPVTPELNEEYNSGEWVFSKGKDLRQTMTSSLSRLLSLSLSFGSAKTFTGWFLPEWEHTCSRGGGQALLAALLPQWIAPWAWPCLPVFSRQWKAPAWSLLQAARLEQLLDQVSVGQQHAAPAVAVQAPCLQGSLLEVRACNTPGRPPSCCWQSCHRGSSMTMVAADLFPGLRGFATIRHTPWFSRLISLPAAPGLFSVPGTWQTYFIVFYFVHLVVVTADSLCLLFTYCQLILQAFPDLPYLGWMYTYVIPQACHWYSCHHTALCCKYLFT